MMVLYSAVSGQPLDLYSLSYLICLCVNYSNCSINPIIYIFKYNDFRQGVATLFRTRNRLGPFVRNDDRQELPVNGSSQV